LDVIVAAAALDDIVAVAAAEICSAPDAVS
jgi:hypothetical protein